MIQPGLVLQKRYQILKQIGAGGFGKTFEVNDKGTPKVLKVLNQNNFPDPEIKQKALSLFQREASVLMRLNHPGIPRVESDGYFTWSEVDKEPFHCLVMEKIEGENLQDWLAERGNQPISQSQAIAWLKQLLEILDCLHQQHYFHRDIKPENIMLKPDGQVVLIDFGSVREVSNTYLAKLTEERDVTVIGSPGYIPLEQNQGRAVPQSDFYALGRTFVYLLTGREPIKFPEDDLTGELVWQNCATQVSSELVDLIDKMMALLPGERPENTQVILQGLDAIATDLPARSRSLVNRKPYTYSQVFRSIRVNASIAGFILLGFIILVLASPQIAGFLYLRGYNQYLDNQFKTAELYFRLALLFNPKFGMAHYGIGSACEDQKKWECADSQYRKASQNEDKSAASLALNNLGRLYIVRQKNYDTAIDLLSQGLQWADEVTLKSALHKNIGEAYLYENRYTEAKTHLEQSINLEGDQADAYCLLKSVLENMGDKKGAIAASEKCGNYSDENKPK